MTNYEWLKKKMDSSEKTYGLRLFDLSGCYGVEFYGGDGVELFRAPKQGEWTESMSKLLQVGFDWLGKEHPDPPVLDDVERRYLESVLRPWKSHKVAISKNARKKEGREYIRFAVAPYSCVYTDLPDFPEGTMYKGMEQFRPYTPERLGLFRKEQK